MTGPRFWKTLGTRRDSFGEFPPGAQEPPPPPGEADPSRRRFLALTGASAALAAGVACAPSSDGGLVVPYAKKPEEVVPGVANYYASAFQEGEAVHGVLVKTREGRPIHVEGNDAWPLAPGAAHFRATADLLGLYDPDRVRAPQVEGRQAAWPQALDRLAAALREARASGKPVLLMTPALLSPARRALLGDLQRALPTLRVAPWEPAADHAGRAARKALYGGALAVRPRFDRAKVILALEADFLGALPGAPEAIAGFAQGRRPAGPGGAMSRLYAAEGVMTLTGSKADLRFPVRPSSLAALGFALAKALAARGAVLPAGFDPAALAPFDLAAWAAAQKVAPASLDHLVADLAAAGREGLVLAGPSLPPEAHAAAALLNGLLGAEGCTLDLSASPAAELISPAEMEELRVQAASGAFAAALFWEANPLHASPDPQGWAKALARVPMCARLGLHRDETAAACGLLLPIHHWLESWNDFDPREGLLALQQPAVGPLHDTRQAEEVLLTLLRALGGDAPADYHAYLQARWRREVYPAGSPVSFEGFWNACLHDGVLAHEAAPAAARALDGEAVSAFARSAAASAPSGHELLLYADAKTWDGRYANNGWLQELPDPVTKNTWGNPVSLSPGDARRLGLSDGDVVRVDLAGETLLAPALVQPGQAEGVLGLALGYGRSAGSVASGVGLNGWPLAGARGLLRLGAALVGTGERAPLARTQEHHDLLGRDIVRLWTLAEYAEKAEGAAKETFPTLYPPQEFPDHKWGMAIDLSACVGCSGCVVACQSENNVPVVGPEQVRRGREMHWIRVDRYYEGPAEAPRTVHQPMVCQQCDDAPCENVCPVQATNHSPDGLNQMAYNRCVGTRYCANNCPYKVRRFNFFDFTSALPEPLDLAFNPEVTVRPRGVMEKCTFCIQRIQNARQTAKGEGRSVRDGEIVPACAAACPARAIVFGDLKDPRSAVSKLSRSDRGFKVLAELGVKPSVTYLADLRNPSDGGKV